MTTSVNVFISVKVGQAVPGSYIMYKWY